MNGAGEHAPSAAAICDALIALPADGFLEPRADSPAQELEELDETVSDTDPAEA